MSRREEMSIGILDFGVDFTVANVPAAAGRKNAVIKVSNGSAGSPCLAISDGTNWKVLATLGNTIASS